MGHLPTGGRDRERYNRERRERRALALPLAVATAGALTLSACSGGDDDGTAFTFSDESTTTADGAEGAPVSSVTEAPEDDGGQPEQVEDGPHTCDTLDGTLVADAVSGVGPVVSEVSSGYEGIETTFSRSDGSEFAYVSQGCRYIVTTDGGEHRVTIESAADPEGIDLFDEWWTVNGTEQKKEVGGVGDGAFLDQRLADQSVTLVVGTGDRVVFVKSQPPEGGALLDQAVLVDLAEVALLVPTG
jgi:hypothetical protein